MTMVRPTRDRKVRTATAVALLTVMISPWGVATAATRAIARNTSAQNVTVLAWRELVAAHGGSGTVGSDYALSGAWQGAGDFRTYPGMPNAKDSIDFDGINVGTATLLAQDYVLTVKADGHARQISVWLCIGPNAAWTKNTCSTDTVAQVGSTVTMTTVNNAIATYRFVSNASDPVFSMAPSAKHSLLVAITGSAKPDANHPWSMGVEVSRTLSVRSGVVRSS